MSNVVVTPNVPSSDKDKVVQTYKDFGATVQVTDQGDGTFTITATFPDQPSPPSDGASGSAGGQGGASAGDAKGGGPTGGGPSNVPPPATTGGGGSPGTYNAKYKAWFNSLVPGGFYSSDPDDTGVLRSIRSNNPGALNYSIWQKGRLGFVSITPDDGHGNRTTIYRMPEFGVGAWYYLLAERYGYSAAGGSFTLVQLAQAYAGHGASQSAVNAYVTGWCHFADQPLTAQSVFHLANDDEMSMLARAMYKHEAAGQLKISNDQILCGIRSERSNSWPAVAAAVAQAPEPAPTTQVAAGTIAEVTAANTAATGVAFARPIAPIMTPRPVPNNSMPPQRRALGTSGAGLIACALLVIAFASNIIWAPSKLLEVWLVTIVLVAASLALFGFSAGRWEAAFIDNRNRMSLSKLQVILWTVAIFSALLSASCFNAGTQGEVSAIMGIVVNPKLWGLLGISVTTAIGTPLALSGKGSRVASEPELDDTKQNLHALTGVRPENIQNNGHILIKADQADARWSDLIRGDDIGNGDTIDFSKVQQLYFTLVTLLIFGLAVAREFVASSGLAVKLAAHQTVLGADKQPITNAIISQLPVPDAGFLGLLAASGAGYLVYKGMSHSKDVS